MAFRGDSCSYKNISLSYVNTTANNEPCSLFKMTSRLRFRQLWLRIKFHFSFAVAPLLRLILSETKKRQLEWKIIAYLWSRSITPNTVYVARQTVYFSRKKKCCCLFPPVDIILLFSAHALAGEDSAKCDRQFSDIYRRQLRNEQVATTTETVINSACLLEHFTFNFSLRVSLVNYVTD